MGGSADWEKVEERIESLKSEIKQTGDLPECQRLQQRITRLSSGVAIINVGGSTEVEMIEKKHRIEDALEAVKSAQELGIVPGGGVALLNCCDFNVDVENEDQHLGAEVIRKSLEAPIRQMAANAGASPDIIVNKILERNLNIDNSSFGWDFKDEKIVDMFKKGIVDPTKVTSVAVRNAVSVASTLITTSNAIIEVK
jgi:chaperonin GroEL